MDVTSCVLVQFKMKENSHKLQLNLLLWGLANTILRHFIVIMYNVLLRFMDITKRCIPLSYVCHNRRGIDHSRSARHSALNGGQPVLLLLVSINTLLISASSWPIISLLAGSLIAV
jgi:hypothetical protein